MSEAVGRELAVEPLGETALLLRFGEGLDPAINRRVHSAKSALRGANLPGLYDIVPAYATLALYYEPAAWLDRNGSQPWRNLEAAVRAVLATPPVAETVAPRVIEVPVCYGGDFGPDLAAVASHAKLAAADVIARHTAVTYTVAMLGFAPGFPYLFGLDPALETPRRANPRTRVPSGSVAIGGAQTGIYPSELSGGWQLIGRTPLALFDARRDPPSLLMPGDRVRFVAIDAALFAARSAQP